MNDPEFKRKFADEDLKKLAQLPEFRRFFWNLLEQRCGTFSSTYTAGDPNRSAFNEGKRAVGLELVALAHRVMPQEFVHIQGEAVNRRVAEAVERANTKE